MADTQTKKPNILVLMPDTWRGDTLGCGGHPAVQTPNLDKLAAMGVRFEQAYTSSPVCMPARTNCMSGLYCHNTGQWHNYGRFPVEAPTYMQFLQANGYQTAHIGKSHFYSHAHKPGESFHLDQEKPFLHQMGHADVLETTGPWGTTGCHSIMTDAWEQKGLYSTFLADYTKRAKAGPFTATWPSPLPEAYHMDSFVGRTAVDYLNALPPDKPFAAFVGFGGPHDPWDPPEPWADKFKDLDVPEPIVPTPPEPWLGDAARAYHENEMGEAKAVETWQAIRRLYYAKMAHIDSLIGDIFECLEVKGELDNTVIIFWSDHGDRLCDRGRYAKGVFYDESARIPIILRLPGNPGAGGVCRSIVSINDLFPTILEAAGIEGVSCFGRSLVSATQDSETVFHDAVFGEVRHGEDHHTMIRTDRYKMLINQQLETLQLFDMVDDPDELQNLAGREDMAATESELTARILVWLLQTATVQDRQGRIRPRALA